MLRNPGLRPYLDQGIERSASYRAMDNFRDNCWYQKWSDGSNVTATGPASMSLPKLVPTFLTTIQQDEAKSQTAALDQLPNGVTWLGRRAINYVKSHPEDPNAAESLALTVRATRYGCYLPPDKNLPRKPSAKRFYNFSTSAIQKSSWAAKTPYYY